jgi:hypothetical protein
MNQPVAAKPLSTNSPLMGLIRLTIESWKHSRHYLPLKVFILTLYRTVKKEPPTFDLQEVMRTNVIIKGHIWMCLLLFNKVDSTFINSFWFSESPLLLDYDPSANVLGVLMTQEDYSALYLVAHTALTEKLKYHPLKLFYRQHLKILAELGTIRFYHTKEVVARNKFLSSTL